MDVSMEKKVIKNIILSIVCRDCATKGVIKIKVYIIKNTHGDKIEKALSSEEKAKNLCKELNDGLLCAIYTYQEYEVE